MKNIIDDVEKTKRQEYLEKREKDKQERNINDIRELAKTPHGRRFLWRILCMTKLNDTGFYKDEKFMYYIEGMRYIGGIMLDEINAVDNKLYAQLQAEYFSEIKSEQVIAEKYFEEDMKNGSEFNLDNL